MREAAETFEKARNHGFLGEKKMMLEAKLESINEAARGDCFVPSRAQLIRLNEYYREGRFSDAEKLAMFFTREFPAHPFGWQFLGALFKQAGRIDESFVASQKAVKADPRDAEAHCNLGYVFRTLGPYEEAETNYE